MKTTDVFFRHFHCPNCEKRKIPNKTQAGITLHAIHFLRSDNGFAYISVTCLHCEAEKNKDKTNTYVILQSRHFSLPLKSWNGLVDMKPKDDGFVDHC